MFMQSYRDEAALQKNFSPIEMAIVTLGSPTRGMAFCLVSGALFYENLIAMAVVAVAAVILVLGVIVNLGNVAFLPSFVPRTIHTSNK
uniref:Uncharacterized protein n=1 Tax=Glossina palpalis gambiensis TaxID=67801 RepID=A0A1B0AQ47_9MUSC